jgi:hypothetical protein
MSSPAIPPPTVSGRFRALDPAEILGTAETLRRRIEERFPNSGLGQVCQELTMVCRESESVAAWLARPNHLLRAALVAVGLGVVGLLYWALSSIHPRTEAPAVPDLLQGMEAAVNLAVLLCLGAWYLTGIEGRWKRRRAHASLHTLRSMAHIIDMHQLTKDPERVTGRVRHDTESSPQERMTPFQLVRYLDYCTEMLALISKVAALHVQQFDDADTRDTVEDIEDLTLGLSQQVWQKIVILDRVLSREEGPHPSLLDPR